MISPNIGGKAGGAAFSLVEVTVALGIASIALLAVVGLLGTAIETSGDAGQDTALAAMAGQVLGELRAAPFDSLGQASPRQPRSGNPTLAEEMEDSVYYFTQEGSPLPGPSDQAHFECVVQKKADKTTLSASSGTINKVDTLLTFTWQVPGQSASTKHPGKFLLNASIARY